jgi:predicted ATPase
MLTRLYVNNFRCMVNFECNFKHTQLILGPNGGGKTTLFDVLAILRDFSVWGHPMDQVLVGFSRTRWQDVPEQTFELDVSGNGGLYNFRLVVDSSGSPARPRVVKEEVLFSGNPIFRFAHGEVHLFNDRNEAKVQYPFDWHRSALATVTERPENTKLTWFKRWLGGLLFVSPDPRRMGSVAQNEMHAPDRDLSNFAAWYRHLRLEGDDHGLLTDLREVIPGFQSMDLKEAGMGTRFLTLRFSIDQGLGQARSSYVHAFHELSDGQRVLIGLYTVLHFALTPGATVFFDEPDNFLSLGEIQPWLDRILDRVDSDETDKQVFVISHHPELLNRLAVQGGLVLERPEGWHTRGRPFTDPAQTGLSPAELVARGWDHE